jgi:hypothetical protein
MDDLRTLVADLEQLRDVRDIARFLRVEAGRDRGARFAVDATRPAAMA